MSDCRHDAPNCEPDMGDMQTQRQQLDEEAREELLDQFIDCFFSFEGDKDPSELERRLEELEAAGVDCGEFDVEQGLRQFHERFDEVLEASPQKAGAVKVEKKPSRVRRPLARIAIIAAALCAFVVTAQAAGLDLIGAFARWTSEQFSFVKVDEGEREPERELTYASLQEALDHSGVTERLSPTKFPNGTEFLGVLVRENKGELAFSATYAVDGEAFFISIQNIKNSPHSEVEINNPGLMVHVAGEIKHYIMNDVNQVKATWYNGAWECYIAGEMSVDDLLVMIDSIYE